MFKKLLSLAAVAMMAYSANAAEPVVLWTAEDAEATDAAWAIVYALTPEEALEIIEPGDYLNMVVTGVFPDKWPQVALNKATGGWPPYTTSGVGGQEYPLTVSFPVTNELYAQIEADGVGFTGDGCSISEISYTKGNPIGPYTVWFGEKKCDWGNAISISADTFADVKAGDQLVVWSSEASCQIILGGWQGLNLPIYGVGGIENMTYEDGVCTLTMIEEYAEENNYGETDKGEPIDLKVFELMQANGVVIQGPTTITRIDYVPAAEVAAAEILRAYEADVDKLLAYQAEVEPILYPEDGEEYSAEVVAAAEDVWYLVGDALMLVEDAYEEAEETGKYVSPLTSEIIEEIEAALKAFTSGINGITVATAARYYNLQGIEVANPAAGQIYIKVANGKAGKVIK